MRCSRPARRAVANRQRCRLTRSVGGWAGCPGERRRLLRLCRLVDVRLQRVGGLGRDAEGQRWAILDPHLDDTFAAVAHGRADNVAKLNRVQRDDILAVAGRARRRPAQRDLRAHHGVIWRLAADSEPPEEKEEAQSEGKEEAVLGLELVWMRRPRQLRGGAWPEVTGEGHGLSHFRPLRNDRVRSGTA